MFLDVITQTHSSYSDIKFHMECIGGQIKAFRFLSCSKYEAKGTKGEEC